MYNLLDRLLSKQSVVVRQLVGMAMIVGNVALFLGFINYAKNYEYPTEVFVIEPITELTEVDVDPVKEVLGYAWWAEYQVDDATEFKRHNLDYVSHRINKFHDDIVRLGETVNVNPNLIRALIRQESMGNPHAVSHTGVVGLMQLTSAAAKDLGVNRYDPLDNLKGGTIYLSQMLERYKGNVMLACAAYNTGPAYVSRAIRMSSEYATTEEVLNNLETILVKRGMSEKWERETVPHMTNVWNHYKRLNTI